MGFNSIIREYFTFNRRERNGVFVLLALILALLLYLFFSDLFFVKEKMDFSNFEQEIAVFEAEQTRIADSIADVRVHPYFSGNTLTEDVERNWKGHGYGHDRQKFNKEEVLVEINSADTLELQSIRGIGSVFARRIVKFREALGGFAKTEQLLEVYGLDKEKFAQISSQISLDISLVKKLNVNAASVEDMSWHPYISKKEAVAIFSKRVKTGDYLNIQEVKNIALIHDTSFVKIEPYLTVQ